MSIQNKKVTTQSEIIDFFRKEQEQENISNWVFVFNIFRYIFNTINILIVALFLFFYLIFPTTVSIVKYFHQNIQNDSIVKNKESQILISHMAKRILAINDEKNYLDILNSAEVDINKLYGDNNLVLSQYFNSGAALNNLMGSSLDNYSNIMNEIAQDKKLFATTIEIIKINNDALSTYDIKDFNNIYQRFELYRTKNYSVLFQKYSELNKNFMDYKQKQFVKYLEK